LAKKLKIKEITRWEERRMWSKYYMEKETLPTSNPDSEKHLIYVWRNLDLNQLRDSEDGFN